MKIKSISDVITNSSTEVFLLETDKSLEEVKQILPKITEGYEEPEILEKYGGPLGRVYRFGGHIYDTSDEVDIQKYMYSILGMSDFQWEWNYQEKEMPQDLQEIRGLWENYFEDNLEYINEEISGKSKYPHHVCLETLVYYHSYLPLSFLDNFLKDVWGRPIPESLKIPETLSLDYWVGKIGFSGKDDNSIPYETWEAIRENFGGTHFHLG